MMAMVNLEELRAIDAEMLAAAQIRGDREVAHMQADALLERLVAALNIATTDPEAQTLVLQILTRYDDVEKWYA